MDPLPKLVAAALFCVRGERRGVSAVVVLDVKKKRAMKDLCKDTDFAKLSASAARAARRRDQSHLSRRRAAVGKVKVR